MRRGLVTVGGVLAVALAAAAGTATGTTAGPEQIAVSTVSGRILLIDSAGRRLASLTRPNGFGWADSDPAWSPDGSRIAFTRTTNGRRSFQVYVMRADGSATRRLTSGRFDERPAWSPDGRWIAYQSSSGLRLVHPDGTAARRVVDADVSAAWPAWTPDGRLAYFSATGWIVTCRLDGSGRRPVVHGREARWSADGRAIAYTLPDGGVATARADGSAVRKLGKGFEPDWSPDRSRIVFTRWPRSNDFSIWVMKADGSGRHRILQHALTPAWRPH
jgi:Tol biopolymer transport system component